jgi:hypothetical protein
MIKSTFCLAANIVCATVIAVRMTISHRAPDKERRKFLAETIASETLSLYVSANDLPFVKESMRCRYDEIVPATDRWWLSEEVYGSLVAYALRNPCDYEACRAHC